MAKIVYYSSEISSETKEFDRVDVSIGDFLKEIGIEKDTINLSLTKDEPGEFGLDYILKEQDRLVIVAHELSVAVGPLSLVIPG